MKNTTARLDLGRGAKLFKRIPFILLLAAVNTGAIAALNPPKSVNTDTGKTLDQSGNGIVENYAAAIALGKSLFWDINAGSDGMACASCHFSAGADSRIVNQLSPGLRAVPEDKTFGALTDYDGEILTPAAQAKAGETKSGATIDGTGTGDYELQPADFPMHSLTDYKNRNSPLEITTNDVVSSNGAFDTLFDDTIGRSGKEKCSDALADVFHAGGHAARQVEPRNTPTTINAVFNLLSFWDGRANDKFNGVDVFGPRDIAEDPNKRLIVLDAGGIPQLGSLNVKNASLASQAVGPPLSALEMSCAGRTFADVGRRLLSSTTRPLESQRIHPNDSLLAPLADKKGKGLDKKNSYAALIQKAFHKKYWAAKGTFKIQNGQLQKITSGNGVAQGGYTQMETNFPMFWGIAIMLYESTLVSDQSKFDTWFDSCRPITANNSGQTNQAPIGNPTVTCNSGNTDPTHASHGGFSDQEVLGFGLFNNAGTGIRNTGNPACSGCHPVTNPNAPTGLVFPTFSEAQFQDGQTFVPVERSRIDLAYIPPEIAPNCTAPNVCGGVHDRGFFNIGVTPTSFDQGNGGTDPYGHPLSKSRMFLEEQSGPLGTLQAVVDPTGIEFHCNTPTLIEGGGTPQFDQINCVDLIPGLPITLPNIKGGLTIGEELELADGTFKTPSIRNVALTAPYFHSGNYSDLRSVVEFYCRGGSRRDKSLINGGFTGDTSGTGPLGKGPIPVGGPNFGINVDFFIRDLKCTDGTVDANGDTIIDWKDDQVGALVAFMKTTTDTRVQCDMAPFDHPELPVPNGHFPVDANQDGHADEIRVVIPAVGSGGYTANGTPQFCLPNTGDLFDNNLRNRLVPSP